MFLDNKPQGASRLRALLAESEPIVAPGAYDCLSARMIEAAGFPAVYMTGLGTAASYLGQPDVGLLGMSEMVDQARRIVQAGHIPVLADADTGYGQPDQCDAHRESEPEVERIAATLRGVPLVFNWVDGGKTPPMAYDRLCELGFRIILFPVSPLLAAAHTMGELLQRLKRDGTPVAVINQVMPFQKFVDFIGLPEIRDLERRFGSDR